MQIPPEKVLPNCDTYSSHKFYIQGTSQCHDIFLTSDWLVYAVRAILCPETNLKIDLIEKPSPVLQTRIEPYVAIVLILNLGQIWRAIV